MINYARTFLNVQMMGKKDLMNYYNKHCLPFVPSSRKYSIKFTDDWCACFTSVVAHMAGVRSNFPFEVSTYYQWKWAQNNGKFCTNPEKGIEGDLVLFDWTGTGTPNHVGILVSVQDGILETIEGNKGDTVGFREIDITSPYIMGIVRSPVFRDLPDDDAIKLMAMRAIRGAYGDGVKRKKVLGRDYEIVQKRVNEIC